MFSALAAACLGWGSPARAETVVMGLGIDAAYAPFYVAQHRGLFKKHGLDAQILKFANGGEGVDAVVAGQAQIAGAADQTTMIRLARADLRPIAIYEESGSYIKLTAQPSITDVRQIKSFGIVKGTTSEYATYLLLEKFGIKPSDVKFIPSGPPELPALLARDDINAYFIWEPWPTLGVKQGGKVLMTSGEVGYTYTMWATVSGNWLETHKAAAKALIAALKEADADIAADPTKAAADLQAETTLPVADTLPFLKATSWTVRDFNEKDDVSYDKIADFLLAQKTTPTKVNFRKAIADGRVD
jgi:NitT/TauT family transport system substrate-binding protein